MAGPKQAYDIHLTTDQMAFIRSMQEKFSISNESKTIRVVIDYLMVTQDVHDTVFGQSRCLRCE